MLAKGAGTLRGTGGMQAKIMSAKLCGDVGVPMFIANGQDPALLYDIVNGEAKGTYFVPEKK